MIGVFIAAFVCGVGAVNVIALRLSNRTTAQESVTCHAIVRNGRNGLKLICGEIAFSHAATFSNRQFR